MTVFPPRLASTTAFSSSNTTLQTASAGLPSSRTRQPRCRSQTLTRPSEPPDTILPSSNCKLASVRCLEIHGDLVVSGSYDTTARIWSISEGRCLRTLQGHFSQIYAVAFDGRRIATGSLDTSVRVWDPRTGLCLAQLQGHTSLVGQLQLRNDMLVTGGSDGSVRVWSLKTYSAIHVCLTAVFERLHVLAAFSRASR